MVDQTASRDGHSCVGPSVGCGFRVQATSARERAQIRESMKTWWLTKRAPEHRRGLPGQPDPEPGSPAVLPAPGRKLIGVLPW